MQKKQVQENHNYFSNQCFLSLQDKTIWYLVDITEVQSLVLKASARTLVHLYDKQTKKVKRIRFAEFESQFVALQSELVDKVVAFNQLLSVEAVNHFD